MHGETARVSQIELMEDVTRALARRGFKTLLPRQMNAVIAGVNKIMEAVTSPYRPAKAGGTLDEWARSDDTGLSSMFMAEALAEAAGIKFSKPREFRFANDVVHPLDADDFRRCVLLLESVPELKPFLNHLAFGNGPIWRRLVLRWEELETAFREELPNAKMPKFNLLLRKIINGVD